MRDKRSYGFDFATLFYKKKDNVATYIVTVLTWFLVVYFHVGKPVGLKVEIDK